MRRRPGMTTMCGSAEIMDNLLKCALEVQEVKDDGRSSALNLYEMKLEVVEVEERSKVVEFE
jgi:hypothetical protein